MMSNRMKKAGLVSVGRQPITPMRYSGRVTSEYFDGPPMRKHARRWPNPRDGQTSTRTIVQWDYLPDGQRRVHEIYLRFRAGWRKAGCRTVGTLLLCFQTILRRTRYPSFPFLAPFETCRTRRLSDTEEDRK